MKSRIREATERFAQLDGWQRSDDPFTMHRLTGGKGPKRPRGDAFPCCFTSDRDPHRVMDHMAWFTVERRAAAIVTMPYHANLVHAQEIADSAPVAAMWWECQASVGRRRGR